MLGRMQDDEAGLGLVNAVLLTAEAFLRESRRLFQPHGITGAQYNVLNVLAATEGEGGLSQRELSDALVVDRSNVTGLVDRMEKAGWVKRQDDPADRRVYRVSLTQAGRRLWAEVEPRYREVVRQVTAGLSGRRMREGERLLGQLKAAAGAWELSAPREGGATTRRARR